MKVKYKIQSIQERLQLAIELELTTIPPYLTAWFSIQRGSNVPAAEIIRSVVMEEMLHMALAGNLLIAINGKVKLGKANMPSYPCRMQFKGEDFKYREFDLNLSMLSKETLSTFMKIELPEFIDDQKLKKETVIPGYTIGEFYGDIIEDLKEVCAEIGEENVFTGNLDSEVSEQYYWHGGGQIIQVKNLVTAIEAIQLIVEQGEGSSITSIDLENLPHFFKFSELYFGKKYTKKDKPEDTPTGELISIDFSMVHQIKDNCKNSDFVGQPELESLSNAFNNNYTMMLMQLEEGFNGNPRAFYTAIMNGMHQLTDIAKNMMQIPLKNDLNGKFAAPTFEWVDI